MRTANRFGGILICLMASGLSAQDMSKITDFRIWGIDTQVHGFLTQGFSYSNDNSFLTMDTSHGSFAFTDGGLNVSARLTDKFRVGAQVYDRNVGNFGKWHPSLDWGYGDYRFTEWFGIRGGKVKTTLGLFNDTQDMDSLHTFALLPQSMYPVDLRDCNIAHTGGDLYGNIPLKRLGTLSYTTYAGNRQDSLYGGYPYLLHQFGISLTSYGGLQYGGDLRWNTPLPGLLVGGSHMRQEITGTGMFDPSVTAPVPPAWVPYKEWSNKDQTNQLYTELAAGNLRLDGEYRRYWRDQQIFNGLFEITTDVRSWYVSASYRVAKHLEFGSYYSRFTDNWVSGVPGQIESPSQSSPDRHLYDRVITARVDLTQHWYAKVEGHFMNGWAGLMYPDGFYPVVYTDTSILKPTTNLLMVRTGFSF